MKKQSSYHNVILIKCSSCDVLRKDPRFQYIDHSDGLCVLPIRYLPQYLKACEQLGMLVEGLPVKHEWIDEELNKNDKKINL